MRDPSLLGHIGLDNTEQKSSQRTGKKLLKTLAASEIDHWNTQTKKVSLREIMSEEIALQEKHDLKREPLMFEKDCATKLKEKQLFKIFPAINQNFLVDIFKDHKQRNQKSLKKYQVNHPSRILSIQSMMTIGQKRSCTSRRE